MPFILNPQQWLGIFLAISSPTLQVFSLVAVFLYHKASFRWSLLCSKNNKPHDSKSFTLRSGLGQPDGADVQLVKRTDEVIRANN
jgi:hypothetical protein